MGQIVGLNAKPKRANLNALSLVPTPAAGEYILVSSDNSMNAAGQGNFDCYIVGDGTTAATALELKNVETLIGVFDISSYHATGGVLAKYADLTAALNDGNNIPQSFRKGGMSIKFVQSSDNKYVQYRYIGTATTGNPNPFLDTANWQGVDSEPTLYSKNLIESGSVYQIKKDLDAQKQLVMTDEENDDFCFTDQSGNVVAKIGNDGVSSTKFNVCDEEGNVIVELDEDTNIDDLKSFYDNNGNYYAFTDAYGNVVFKISNNGVSAKQFNICDAEGNVVAVVDGSVGRTVKSLYTGKHFCSLGDSIAYQNKWQPNLVEMFGLDYDVNETKDATHPLGVGGSAICPFIRIDTTETPYPCYDDQQQQLTDADNNPLYFHTGQGVNQSVWYRSRYLAALNPDLVIINGGQNDEVLVTFQEFGTASDTPYEGKQYVKAAYAVVAKYYGGINHDIAILDDGSAVLDPEYTGGDYTILTSAPTLCACVAGMIKKICTDLPAAKVIGNTIMRFNRDLDQEREATVNKKNAIINTYNHYGIPVANLWDNMGVNVYNYTTYYGGATDVHPNDAGGRRMAEIIAKCLQ